MNKIDMAALPHTASNGEVLPDRHALKLIECIRTHYTHHFDNLWYQSILDRLAFSDALRNDIRLLLELQSIAPADLPRLRAGLSALGEFIYFSRTRVLPELQRELGTAGFSRRESDNVQEDEIARMAKVWFLQSLPARLGKLADLTEALRESTAKLHKAG